MKRFWMSWYDAEEDYRPLHDPPSEAILGWWCSGEHADGRATLVALVQADDLPSACVAVARVKQDSTIFLTPKPARGPDDE